MLIKPLRDELIQTGVKELATSKDVDDFMKKGGAIMLVVNSVCECATNVVRPAVRMVMENSRKPGAVASVFAGQDLEATHQFRSYISEIPASSPSIAIFKDSELVCFTPQQQIEGKQAAALANDLMSKFDEFC